jgi:hypothetical protein
MTPIQIKRPDVTEDIRTLATLMKTSITDAVASAVKNQISAERAKSEARFEERKARSMKILKELWALPIIGPLITDDDLYDEDGLPK